MVPLRSIVLWGFVIFCQNVNSAVAATATATDFCYKDQHCSPTTWPGVCQTGQSQSPINIPLTSSSFANAPTTDLHVSKCYSQLQTFTLDNIGVTALVALRDDQTSICTMTGGLLGESYTFAQMHFHWGSTDDHGSEHSVDDHKYVMEGHLVHYKSKFNNASEAVASNERNALTVVAVFFTLSPTDNPALEPIVRALGYVRSAETEHQGSGLVLAKFMDISSTENIEVLQYDGSLTTPGCNEIVLWNIFHRPQPISRAQLAAFRDIQDDTKRSLDDNDRPLQKLNGREIRYYRTSIEARKDGDRQSFVFRPLAFLPRLLRLRQMF